MFILSADVITLLPLDAAVTYGAHSAAARRTALLHAFDAACHTLLTARVTRHMIDNGGAPRVCCALIEMRHGAPSAYMMRLRRAVVASHYDIRAHMP